MAHTAGCLVGQVTELASRLGKESKKRVTSGVEDPKFSGYEVSIWRYGQALLSRTQSAVVRDMGLLTRVTGEEALPVRKEHTAMPTGNFSVSGFAALLLCRVVRPSVHVLCAVQGAPLTPLAVSHSANRWL